MSAKTAYLFLYNTASALAWSVVLSQTVTLFLDGGAQNVYPHVGEWTKWTQTAAALEILHALFGVVRTSLFTTLMQVASRLLLVWPIVNVFPQVASNPAYSSMLVAWSITEVVRYSYFAIGLAASQPAALTWLRYNTFFVLYPLGISSEMMLIYRAVEPASELNPLFGYALYAILVIYFPGAYVLFTHMMAQRRKVLRNLKTGKSKSK